MVVRRSPERAYDVDYQREKRLEQTEEGVVVDMPRPGLRHTAHNRPALPKAMPSVPGAIS
jgi:hypothetical protein